MLVMISQSMKGMPNDIIRQQREGVIQKFKNLHIDVANTIFEDIPEKDKYNKGALFYIAKSIDILGQVDAVYFMPGWEQSSGCRIEYCVCKEYGIKILPFDFLDEPIKDQPIIKGLNDYNRPNVMNNNFDYQQMDPNVMNHIPMME